LNDVKDLGRFLFPASHTEMLDFDRRVRDYEGKIDVLSTTLAQCQAAAASSAVLAQPPNPERDDIRRRLIGHTVTVLP
jgi:hypothetical protein